MHAYLTVSPEVVGDVFTKERVLEFIKTSGVYSGLLQENVEEMVGEQVFNREVLIAEGKEPIAGKRGRIEYNFNPTPTISPEIRDDGSVDYMNVNLVQKVVPGQLLARVIPPISGTAGFDIQGHVLPAKSGRKAELHRGKNTSFVDGNDEALMSDAYGHVRLAHHEQIEVVTVYQVKGDLNYTTGNIDFNGDVIVHGDVLSGFKIVATGIVEVKGVVEDATIESGISVIVRGGFIGAGKGSISAVEDVIIRYVHNQQVKAGRDIIIANEATNARLFAGQSVKLNGGAGVLVGGTTTAKLSVECKTLGNEAQARTEVTLTFESDLESKAEGQRKFIAGVESQLAKIQNALKKMVESDLGVGNVDASRQRLYGSLYSAENDLKENLVVLNDELREVDEKIATLKAALFVKSTRFSFPGVSISIAGAQLLLLKRLERQHFMHSKGMVVGVEMKRE